VRIKILIGGRTGKAGLLSGAAVSQLQDFPNNPFLEGGIYFEF